MKRLFLLLGLSAALAAAVAASALAGPNGNKLTCFSGTTDLTIYGGTCSLTTGGVATLNNTDGNLNGDYSGVYLQNSNLDGKKLTTVNKLAFDYTGIPTNGSPRISLPLDTNGDGATDVYAFISAFWCNDGAGHLNALTDQTCMIFVGNQIAGYANWDAFVAAFPTATVGADALPFIIADDAGSWTVSNVQLGKGPAKA
jgi:hypothetical protein